MSRKVDLFLLGPPKTASTWMHACLSEHPEISTPHKDSLRFFDNLFHRGVGWYHDKFEMSDDKKISFDPTPSYIWSQWAPHRIVDYNPNAKVAVCLRNPVDRAFSHYWHVRKHGLVQWKFEDVLTSANTFEMFLAPGFVADKIRFFQERLPEGHVKLLWFDELARNPKGQITEFCRFAGIDPDFEPSVLNKKVNAAGPRMNWVQRALHKIGRTAYGDRFDEIARQGIFWRRLTGKGEYLDGVPPEMRAELVEVYRAEIAALEALTGRDLDAWRS